MTIAEAILLGAVQGLFMFVPVSSTSHLALTQHWLVQRGSEIANPESPEMVFFNIVVHVGTLVSIAIVFRKSLGTLVSNSVADVRAKLGWGPQTEGLYFRLMLLGLLSVAITGSVGLLIREPLETVFANPLLIAGTLTVTGVLLWWTDTLGPRPRGLRDLTPLIAIGIGLAQALALTPGLSRSGLTIVVALLLGLRRRWAAEYSFFIAIPTILAANVALPMLEPGTLAAFEPGPLVVGFVVAAVVGTFALLLVLKLLYRAKLRYFSYYLWALATLILLDAAGVFSIGLS